VSLKNLEDIFLEIYLNILDLTFEATVQACVCVMNISDEKNITNQLTINDR